MDFHSIARRELQALCKKNKIPANITNVAMADALKSLEIVEGIEEIMEPSQSEEKHDVWMTPAPAGVASRRRRAKESTVQRVYGTRRSARLVEKSTKILNEVDDSEASKISKHESLTKIGYSDVKKNLKRSLDDMDEGSAVTGVDENTSSLDDPEECESEVVSTKKHDAPICEEIIHLESEKPELKMEAIEEKSEEAELPTGERNAIPEEKIEEAEDPTGERDDIPEEKSEEAEDPTGERDDIPEEKSEEAELPTGERDDIPEEKSEAASKASKTRVIAVLSDNKENNISSCGKFKLVPIKGRAKDNNPVNNLSNMSVRKLTETLKEKLTITNNPIKDDHGSEIKYGGDESLVDKMRRLGNSKMQANTRPKTRQAFSVVNGSQEQAPTSGPPSNPASECGVTEFTKEDVEALLCASSSRASQEEAIKRKEALGSEVVCLRGELQQARDDRDRLLLQVQALSTEVMKYKEFTGEYVSQLDSLVAKTSQLESTCLSQSEEIQRLKEQLAFAEQKLKLSDMSNMEARSVFEEQKALVTELQNRLAEADSKIVEGEKVRKKLHNTILELKGNIRVFCRVRPLLSDDGVGSDAKVVSFPTSTEQMGRGIDLTQNGKKHSFTFDKVFMPENSQEDVFVEISQLVQSALDGYKVCIFAYGQTGSGKTYTMMGRPNQPSEKGLIPRTLEQVFETKQHLEAEGWKYEMQVSMLEIYNETIRDLLAPNRPSLDASRAENVAKQQYAIKNDAHGNTYVSDLTIVDVRSSKEVSYLLERASQSRSVSKTQMNEQSSRSHFVFTLRIMGVNEGTDQQVQGVLNLIDLAGSERLSRSDATGDRLKETLAINKSLSSLSDVIFALAKKEEHVPFRNSKLTYLLQPCLGGDSKTLMFVNLAPDPASASESLCSLRFAARVNACEIGIPRQQTSLRSIDSRLSRSQFLQSPQSVHRSSKSRSQFAPC